MLVGHQPIVAVGPGTYLDELMRIARADNIADAVGQQWPHLSMEYIIAMRPEVILDGAMGTDPASSSDFWKSIRPFPRCATIACMATPKTRRCMPGPRVGQSLEIIARRFIPRRGRTPGAGK